MAQSLAIPRVIPNDWKRLGLIVNKIKFHLGSASSPTFAGVTITGLTHSTLIGANASKALESVTVGTGLAYARPTLSLSHLSIELLSDPGADRIIFWDDTASACKWLVPNTLISITGTNLDVDNDLHNYDWTSVDATDLKVGSVTQAWDAQLDDIAALAVTDGNFIVGDGTNWVAESGATVRTSLGLGTGDSPQFTAVSIGNVDTTITRVSAGVIAVEGTTVMLVGGAPSAHSIASHNDTTGTGTELNTLTDGSDAGALHSHAAAYQPLDDILTDLADLTAVADNEFIVGTGAGTYAHENAATAATSMGLGTGDSPTFSNLTVTNAFSITDLSTTGDTQLGDNVALDNVGINVTPDADVLIKGSFASTGSGDTFCYNDELFTHTEDDSTAHTYIYGTNSSMTVNDDLTVNGIFVAVGHKQFLEASLTTITGVGDPAAYLYGYHAVVDWAAAALAAETYAACVVGFKADVTGNLGTVGNTIKWGADISVSESAVTNYGGRFTAQGATYNYGVWGYTTGAHTTNYGLYGYAGGATTNWGLYVAAGNAFFAGIVNIEGTSVTVGKASTTTGTIVLHDSGSANTITLTVPDSLAGSLTFTLPPTDGDNTNVLQTNGSGVLTWVAAGGGNGTPGGADTQIQFNDGGSFGGDADLTWNKTNNNLMLGGVAAGTNGQRVITIKEGTTPESNCEDTVQLYAELLVSEDDITGGQTYEASSEHGDHPPDDAFDDDSTTSSNGWVTFSGDVTNEWIRCYWSSGHIIIKVRIQPCYSSGVSTRNVRHCKLEGSNNGSDWTKISANSWNEHCQAYNTDEIEIDQIANYTDWAEIEFTNSTSYTYYRIFAHDNWGDSDFLGIKEIEMMELLNTELRVRDSGGNITTLSSHNFKGMPSKLITAQKEKSNDLAWTFHGEKNGKFITVDMFGVVQALEQLVGKKFIYTGIGEHNERTSYKQFRN